MRPITVDEINSIQTARQFFKDCYLVSSLNSLTYSENGRKILQKNIQTNGKDYYVRFNDVYGKIEGYLIKSEEHNFLEPYDEYYNHIAKYHPHNPIIKAVEVAMQKLLNIHPRKKPFISRFERCQENFEYNKPSNFLKMFTGKQPLVINESGLRMNLKNYPNFVNYILKRISKENNSSFVAGSGYPIDLIKNDLTKLHCYTIKPSMSENSVYLYDGRRQENLLNSSDDIISKVKFLCGYFNNMLE